MDIRAQLIGLLEYTERMASLSEHAVFRLADYRALVFHEQELRNRPGIHHDLVEGEERTWLRIDRLARRDPPAVPKDVNNWLTVGRDPFRQPSLRATRVVTVTREEAEALVESGRAKAKDVEPAMRERDGIAAEEFRDVLLRLENDAEAQAAVRAYLEGPWISWAEQEKPRRETIRIYEAFFSLQQAIETQGIERPLEVVWGVGVARWKHPRQEIDHPLVEQLVEIDIDADDGAIRMRSRSIEPVLVVKPFQDLEIPGADKLQRFAREHFRQLGAELELSPFISATFEPVLRQAFSLLDPEGRYHPDQIEDLEDRTLPAAGSTLVVTDTWAIYARPRSANIVVEDIERLKARVEESEAELPGTARRLVTLPDDTRPAGGLALPLQLGTGLAQRIGETTEVLGEESAFYFPKPFNDEQVEIVRRLEREDGIVVQGPPGTGKTHTIANIVCHYMATGRRVLVVSHGEAALSVLRDQIPAEVRELAISLLTSERQGLKQLERAVRLLADDVSKQAPRSLARAIDEGEASIIQLKEKIANIDREIRRWAEKHLERIGGSNGVLPMELAKRVVEGYSRYRWFQDRPDADATPRFDDADIARLREARKKLGADLTYLQTSLPSPSDLPDAAVVAAIHDDLLSADAIASKSRSGELPPLSLTMENGLARAEALVNVLDGLIAAVEAREAEAWLSKIFWLAHEGEAHPEAEIFDHVRGLLTKAEQGRRQFLRTPVRMPNGVFADDRTLAAVRDVLERQAAGGHAFTLLSFGQGRIKALHAEISIDERPVTSAKSARHALAYLAWRDTLKELRRRWNQLAGELGLPELDQNGDAVGRWAAETQSKIDVQLAAANEHLPTAIAELPRFFPFGLSLEGLTRTSATAQRARQALELNLSRHRLEASREKLNDARNRLRDSDGEIVKEMRSFLDEVVGSSGSSGLAVAERWQALVSELKRIRTLAPEIDAAKAIAGKISASGAPRWAACLISQPVEGVEDELTTGDWRDAWSWAQQERFLKAIDGRVRLSQLAKERSEAVERLERVFREVVRDRTFLMLNRNMTDLVRSALVMFVSAIRQIGAGTGIRARRFRRDARDAMDRCYSAVPCWIMPTWRVSESLPSVPGSFDLVVIDEASQSDVMALPAILRGQKVLVVGDDKQVSPVAVGVEEKKILQLRHNYLEGQPFAAMLLPGRSLYDLMGAIFPGQRIMLKEHFRCVEPIIQFSAREFYDNQIRPLRIPKASERLDPPLIDILVENGSKQGKINLAEARVIVDEVEKIASDPAFSKRTIGVVSLVGANQAQKIQNMLLERIGEELFVRHQIACGDSATFQGKERDIMFVSMVEAPNGHVTKTGLMFQQRFNVALSRARDRMYLVRSVDEPMLKPDDLKAKVIRHFKDPMQGGTVKVKDGLSLCDSDFEREVYRILAERGWRVRPQVRAGDYRIDLVVEGAEDRRLAIELDGDKYHGPERWAEDYRRQLALERMGWRFWRCWGSSWTLDPEGCLTDLEATLEAVGIAQLGSDAMPAIYTEHRVVGRVEDEDTEEQWMETVPELTIPQDRSRARSHFHSQMQLDPLANLSPCRPATSSCRTITSLRLVTAWSSRTPTILATRRRWSLYRNRMTIRRWESFSLVGHSARPSWVSLRRRWSSCLLAIEFARRRSSESRSARSRPKERSAYPTLRHPPLLLPARRQRPLQLSSISA